MADFEVFFDFSCPFCHRVLNDLKDLLKQYPDARTLWRPIEAHPVEEEPGYGTHADRAVEAALFVREHGGDERSFIEHMLRAVFDSGRSANDPGVLKLCAAAAGADPEALEQALSTRRYDDARLRANRHAFQDRGVWAVPAFVAGALRLDAVEGVGLTPAQVEDFLASLTQ
ncbi:MAG: DsbA family protein [Christensenellaceae bacterium]|nr:DsbA family protein [Christensenellaceae bacterium]MEA5066140.1 DsbA family protein [Eubacteriales bacterium]MEA5067857.1 DsbA family protein [Christensenellaceae bacterium]